MIVYAVPKAGRQSPVVSLKVYDALGREVATLVNGIQQPGSYRVRFDGRALPSGIYFYRLSADGKPTTRKMLPLK